MFTVAAAMPPGVTASSRSDSALDASTEAFDFVDRAGVGVDVAQAQGDVDADFGEFDGAGPADPAGCSGDEGDLAVKRLR